MKDHNSPAGSSKGTCGFSCDGLYYWATLVVAVIAVPAFAAIVIAIVPAKGSVQLVVFVLACWLCTYLGMLIMRNPKFSGKIFHHKNKD